jgi:hypothetical protein
MLILTACSEHREEHEPICVMPFHPNLISAIRDSEGYYVIELNGPAEVTLFPRFVYAGPPGEPPICVPRTTWMGLSSGLTVSTNCTYRAKAVSQTAGPIAVFVPSDLSALGLTPFKE